MTTHVHDWRRLPTEDAYACACGVRVTGHAMDCITHPERYEPSKRVAIVLGGIEARVDGPTGGEPTTFCADGEDVRIVFRDPPPHNPDTCPRCRKEGV